MYKRQVLDVVDDDDFLSAVGEKGSMLADGVRALPVIDVRARGLMIGFDVPDAPGVARRALLEQRLVVNATGPETLRLLPPLTVTPAEIEDALSRLEALLG